MSHSVWRGTGSASPQDLCEKCAVPKGTRAPLRLYPGLTPWAKTSSARHGGLDFAQSFHPDNSRTFLAHALWTNFGADAYGAAKAVPLPCPESRRAAC